MTADPALAYLRISLTAEGTYAAKLVIPSYGEVYQLPDRLTVDSAIMYAQHRAHRLGAYVGEVRRGSAGE